MKHNNVGRDRDWTILAPVFISIPLSYVTCVNINTNHFLA